MNPSPDLCNRVSETDKSRPTSRSGLSKKPVVYRSGMPTCTFKERHIWMAASL
jgi:hypothetical protein